MKAFLALLLTCCIVSPLSAQVVYGLETGSGLNLAEIDLQTGQYSVTVPIPNANYSVYGSLTFDHKSRSYIYWGGDNNGVKRFYSVQVDGQGINNPPIPTLPNIGTPNPVGVEFDLSTGFCYGIINAGSGLLGFIQIDLFTGQMTLLNTFPGITGPSNLASTFDSNNHRYIFQIQENTPSGDDYLYFLDASNGQLIKQIPVLTPQASDNRVFTHFEWDNNTDQLFGTYGTLVPNSGPSFSGSYYICEIDTGSGVLTNLTANPILQNSTGGLALFTNDLEQNTREYMFAVHDPGQGFRLKFFNLDSMAFTLDLAYNTNVKQLQIDNSAFAARTYGLQVTTAVPTLSELNLKVYPQPAHDRLSLQVPSEVLVDEIRIFDLAGSLVKSVPVLNKSEITMDLNGQAMGMYGLLLYYQGQKVGSQKFLKQ